METTCIGRSNGFSLIKVPGGWNICDSDGFVAATFTFEGARCHVWNQDSVHIKTLGVNVQTSNRHAESIRIFVKLAAGLDR